jgi:glycosyltransferase involved in cell wall biosynthesis
VHILGLCPHPEHVCARYRLAAFRPHLARAGIQLDLEPIPSGAIERLRLFKRLGQFDAVILQRRLLSPVYLHLLRRYSRRLFFDFDDAVFQSDSYRPRPWSDVVRRWRFRAVVRAADRIVAGNEFLHAEAGRSTRADRVVTIPTCVEPEVHPLARHERTGPGTQLVWIGSSSTLQGIERERELFDAIARHVPGIELKIICDRFPTFRHLSLRPVLWSLETENLELAAADIGVSWVPDDRWSRGKCGLKILQYMAAGLPVIANPVGVQSALVRHGETGFLATTVDEWSNAVRRLAGDPELRRRMGRAGRDLVERGYSVVVGAEHWRQLLTSLPVRVAA